MTDTIVQVALFAALAGLVHGLTGFGFGVVAMPLMLMALPYRETVAFVAVLGLVVFLVSYLKHRAHHSIRNGLAFIIASVIGVLIGVTVTATVSDRLLIRVLGVVMCGISAGELFTDRTKEDRGSERWVVPLGVVSGSLSGAFNMGGPIAVMYLYRQPWPKEQIAAVLQVVFGVTGVVRVASLWHAGLLQEIPPSLFAWAIGPTLIGLAVGMWAFSRISKRWLRPLVFLGIGLVGLKYATIG